MGTNTKIGWCDHTFNPWIGCEKVSEGCENCYAEAMDKRFGHDCFGKGKARRRTSAKNWRMPLTWNERSFYDTRAAWPGRHIRPKVFCGSMCDWLDDAVPVEWFADLLEVIRDTPHLDWLLLTKRIENWQPRIRDVLSFYASRVEIFGAVYRWLEDWLNGTPPANVWLGVTAENQAMADKRIPLLLQIPAAKRFVSVEPMLGDIELDNLSLPMARVNALTGEGYGVWPDVHGTKMLPRLDWVICGGESGPNARLMHPTWARNLRDQCKTAGVPFFFKQLGEWGLLDAPPENDRGVYVGADEWMRRVGKKAAGDLLDGERIQEWPV